MNPLVFYLSTSGQEKPVLWFRSYVYWVKIVTLTLLFSNMIFLVLVVVLSLSRILLVVASLLLVVVLAVVLRGLLYTPVVVEVSSNGVFVIQGLLRRRLIHVPSSDIQRVEFRFRGLRDVVLPSRYWLLPLPVSSVVGVVRVYSKTQDSVVEFYVLRDDIPLLSRTLRELGF